jgi:predicted amidohydrolase
VKKLFGLLTALLLALNVFAAAPANEGAGKPMKKRRNIIVSSLGPAIQPRLKVSDDAAVERMIEFWRQRIAAVLPDKPDLIVLPELCDRYGGMTPDEYKAYYAVRGDRVLDFMRRTAKENACYIAYPTALAMPDGTWRNSTVLIGRDGETAGIYHKNYPTIGDIDRNGTLAGKDAPVFDTDFGRVGMAICFDLNFEELMHRYAAQRPDLILFSSYYHGGLMQNVWAYCCRSYFVGSVAGLENNIIDPLGAVVARSAHHHRRITTAINLDYQVVHLDENREKLAAVKAKYGPGVTISDPGYVGAVLLSSSLDDVTSAEMVQEFKIELWDEYYRRSADHRDRVLEAQPQPKARPCCSASFDKK